MSYDCSCDYDQPLFYRATKPTARKGYRCDECSHEIRVGQRYERVVAMWPESRPVIDRFLTCEPCHDLRQWVRNNVPCFCWAHGNMLEDAREAVQEAAWRAPAETRGLRFGLGRRLMQAQRFHSSRVIA